MSSLQIATNTFILPCVILTIVRKAFCIVKHYALTKFVLRIFFFHNHYNNLEKWLSERVYREKLVIKEILKARSQSSKSLSDNKKMSRNDDRATFNNTYYLVFKSIRNILEESHILLAPDEQHGKVFTNIPRAGFKNSKSLKDHLIR